jgi:GNAT superfamily N-acetyltransferase
MSMRLTEVAPQRSTIPVRRLSRLDQFGTQRHFLALGSDDRRLRFGGGQSDLAVRAYVLRINFEDEGLFGVVDDDLQLVGVAHLVRSDGHAELGLSVLVADRKRGIGAALLKRSHAHARNWGARRMLMRCLAENRAIMRLACREGMDVVHEAGEADAWLNCQP